MSDARSIADTRLAKGEITPEQHRAIIASLNPDEEKPSIQRQPAKSDKSFSLGGFGKFGTIMAPIGAAMMLIGRDDKLQTCKAAARTYEALNDCAAQHGGSAVIGVGLAIVAVFGAVLWSIEASQKK